MASRTRSKTKENYLVSERISEYLQYLEDTVISEDDEDYAHFLNSLTQEVPDMEVSPSKISSFSSSGSSIIRILQDSPDSPGSIQPGSSSSSNSSSPPGYFGLERASSHSLKEDRGLSIQKNEAQEPQVHNVLGVASPSYNSIERMETVSAFTELINTDVQVNKSLVFQTITTCHCSIELYLKL